MGQEIWESPKSLGFSKSCEPGVLPKIFSLLIHRKIFPFPKENDRIQEYNKRVIHFSPPPHLTSLYDPENLKLLADPVGSQIKLARLVTLTGLQSCYGNMSTKLRFLYRKFEDCYEQLSEDILI